MSPTTARTVLTAAALIVAGFGVVLALGAHPATAGPSVFLVDLIVWPLDGAQDLAEPATRLALAVAGGVMLGWGLTLYWLVRDVLDRAPQAVRRMIASAVIAWFVVDSSASVAAGAPLNAVFNVGFLVLFLWPVAVLGRPAPGTPGTAG